MITITHAERINYSLYHAGLRHVIASAAVGAPGAFEVSLGAYSQPLHLNGGLTEGTSPQLEAAMFARLGAPVRSQLVVRNGAAVVASYPVTLSPLCAWDQGRPYARATAAFVLENDRLVGELLREAGAAPSPSGGAGDERERAALLYAGLRRLLTPCYYYDRNSFPGGEQAVRFPRQMKYDGGGTCVDFALVYAAALYKAGLRPVVLILGEEFGARHALVAFWTRAQAAGAVLKTTELRAALAAGALLPVEVTGLSSGLSFAEALEEGAAAAGNWNLLWGVDVSEARREGLVSLPGRPSETVIGGWEVRPVGESTVTRTAEAAAVLRGLRVRVVESAAPADRGLAFELRGYRARIGRDPNRDEICLRAPSVSSPHAVLFVEGDKVFLEDLASKNGTLAGGRRVPPHRPVAVRPGEEFELGGVRLRLEAGGPKPEE